MSLDGNVVGVVAGVAFLLYFVNQSRRARDDHGGTSVTKTLPRYPPTPPGNFFWGHRLTETNSFLKTASWIRQYGPLISYTVGPYRYVVIGTYKAARGIMERQGGSLVDRPQFVASGPLLGGEFGIVLTPAGPRFQRMRRVLHTHLRPKAAQTYDSMQTYHAKRIILSLLEDPDRFQDHACTFSTSFMYELAYGKKIPTYASDPLVFELRRSLKRFADSLRPGSYLVDSFPWLQYLPWYGRELDQGFVEDRKIFQRQVDIVKGRMNDPDLAPSFVKFLLSREMDFGLNETEIAFFGGAIISGGQDAVTLAICISMMAAARHPDAQAAVQAELDAVIGDRLPSFDDETSLPVLRAFVLETMRWRPILPSGIPHRATQDIIWGDYYIPAGATVLGNHWSISRDPEAFPDPDSFNLKRWLTSDGKVREDLKFPYFGFGRRICPSQHLVNRSLFITTLLTLWAFHISVDESKPVNDLAYLSASIVPAVAPISLNFKPRMAKETLGEMMKL